MSRHEIVRNFLNRVKKLLLVHFDPDAGHFCRIRRPYKVGAVLYHNLTGEHRPIAFVSATLFPADRKYSQVKREALGLKFAITKFNTFIYGRKFTLVTDNKPSQKILGPKTNILFWAAQRLQRCALLLANYDYHFICESNLRCADMLSRLPLEEGTGDSILQITIPEPLSSLDIETKTIKDPVLSRVVGYRRRG